MSASDWKRTENPTIKEWVGPSNIGDYGVIKFEFGEWVVQAVSPDSFTNEDVVYSTDDHGIFFDSFEEAVAWADDFL